MVTEEYDLLVVGATPAGIASAVRAAREGLSVLLTQHTRHLGGMIAGGLNVMDTLHDGARAPLFDECCRGIISHYRRTLGADAEQLQLVLPGPRNRSGARLRYEPHVGEAVLTTLVETEPSIRVLRGYFPWCVRRDGPHLRSVTLREMDGPDERTVHALTFIDATYEGDLAALAQVPYRVGRESRSEYNEPHAGRIFTTTRFATGGAPGFPRAAAEGRLNLRPFRGTTDRILEGSTGEGDHAIQAFNFRVCLTEDPENLRPVEKPEHYDRSAFFSIRERWGAGAGGVNRKGSWNAANLTAGAHDYPEADWPTRQRIARRHRDFAIGLLYFLQTDPEVPAEVQARARRCGLARDEFTDNDNFPWEMYVREARRIVGRHVFTEHDARLAAGLQRTPIHADSIGIAEWPMDSHDCTSDSVPGAAAEGKILLSEETRPSQIPYRSLLPQGVDNLLVPVCLSATHVGWGTIRLEPTWMPLGETAGWAAVLARRQGVDVADLDVDTLQRQLVEARAMISFFNDVDVAGEQAWVPAVQYLGTKGFFASYDARPHAPLLQSEAACWIAACNGLRSGHHDPHATARTIATAEGGPVPAELFYRDLAAAVGRSPAEIAAALPAPDRIIRRGHACEVIYQVLR